MVPEPYRREDGTIMVPTRADSGDGTVRGVGYQPLTDDHPQHEEWVAYIAALGGEDWAVKATNGAVS